MKFLGGWHLLGAVGNRDGKKLYLYRRVRLFTVKGDRSL